VWWPLVLAQDVLAQDSSTGLLRPLVWLGILIAMVIAAGLLLVVLRRRFLGPDRTASSSDPLDLESIRRLHREGELSDEEFEAAKEAILGSLRGPRDGAGNAGSS
jgi:uncharacterized membrane protein